MTTTLQIFRLVAVMALLIVAALLATPPGRLPLAMRGLVRILRRDRSEPQSELSIAAPTWKRTLAFVLVLAALALALA